MLQSLRRLLGRANGVQSPATSTDMYWYGEYVQKNYSWHHDEQLIAWQNAFLGDSNPCSDRLIRDRYFNLYNLAKLTKSVPGDTVECGVRHGFGSYLIAKAVEDTGPKHHYGFDSFEGLSEPEPCDVATDCPKVWKKYDLAVDVEPVRQRFADMPHVTIHKGWIPDVLDELSARTLSLIHIDVDLYRPAKDSLERLYPLLSERGMIVFDDYGSTSCPGEKRAVDEFFADKPEDVVPITTSQALIIKQ